MCILSNIYKYIKYIYSLFPPCIEYYSVDLSVIDLSANIVPADLSVIDLSANILTADLSVIDLSANILPADLSVIDLSANIVTTDLSVIDLSANILTTDLSVIDLSANIVNPIISKKTAAKPQSLSKILRYKYHLSVEKSNTLSEEYRTLKVILSLSKEELAECKTSSGRRYGKNIAKQTYDLLHSTNS